MSKKPSIFTRICMAISALQGNEVEIVTYEQQTRGAYQCPVDGCTERFQFPKAVKTHIDASGDTTHEDETSRDYDIHPVEL
ncbi:hypothetical protein EGH21_05480 [Halomicroarcula sp. F13]|uniref:C2H2-type domain-containing protein n=1 Tax=Haloarcula rubra TaxID=2487747 RepID=A0AAW4PLP1_9EURY|nr:hypothetical protein [Halomicroarcula rubra]MBX0322478.1 hypothetical protein [Halomicroarcula rubra]